MVRKIKGLTTSMSLSTKNPNNKKSIFAITEITNQDFRKLINKFKNPPYIGYKSK